MQNREEQPAPLGSKSGKGASDSPSWAESTRPNASLAGSPVLFLHQRSRDKAVTCVTVVETYKMLKTLLPPLVTLGPWPTQALSV